MDETQYEAGYRESLTHTIEHITNRITEEKKHGHLWLDQEELESYLRALQDVKSYLIWIRNSSKYPL
jgi:hypothetical protein